MMRGYFIGATVGKQLNKLEWTLNRNFKVLDILLEHLYWMIKWMKFHSEFSSRNFENSEISNRI